MMRTPKTVAEVLSAFENLNETTECFFRLKHLFISHYPGSYQLYYDTSRKPSLVPGCNHDVNRMEGHTSSKLLTSNRPYKE